MSDGLAITLPADVFEAIAERAADILAERAEAEAAASPWLTAQETAEYMSCSRQHVYDLTSSRRLPAEKPGGKPRSRPRFHRAVLDAYLAGDDPWAVAERLPHASQNGSARRLPRCTSFTLFAGPLSPAPAVSAGRAAR